MRTQTIITFCLLIISASLFAQQKWKSDKRVLKQEFSAISIDGTTVWVGKYEVSNFLFKQFLNDSGNKTDTSMSGVPEHLKGFFKLYQKSPVFAQYPAVNLSYDQALAFCTWYESKLNSVSKSSKVYKVSLLSESEWKVAARGGNPDNIFPWEGLSLRNEKGLFRANFTFIPQAWIKRNEEVFEVVRIKSKATAMLRHDIISPVASYWPNEFGLYNMAGNVAELLSDGKIIGGSWKDTGYYMMINAPSPYKKADLPAPYVGFRLKVTEKP